jgi:hypothetical protein
MTTRAGRTAAEAAKALAAQNRPTHRFPDDWVRRVLELETHERVADEPQQPQPARPGRPPKTGWLHRTGEPVRHEHVEVGGYNVEVTEDEIGVVELHLE